jgi:hypothetical protein
VRCPRCNTKVADEISICPNCDEILDASFLEGGDDGSPPESHDPTEVGPAPQASAPRASLRPARLRGTWDAAKQPAAPAPEPEPQVSAPKGTYLNDAVEEGPPDPLAEARRSLDDLGAFFKTLPTGDRVAAAASLLLLLTMAMPWRWTKLDEEVIGLFAAVPAALLAAGVTVLVYLRARIASGKLGRPLALTQVVAAAFNAGFCLWFVRAVTDVRTQRVAGKLIAMPLSTAEPGAYAGLLCAAVAAAASLTLLGGRR